MTVENAADRAAFVHTDDFGEAATYTPLTGSASSISVLMERPSEDVSLAKLGAIQVGYRAHVRADDIASPVEGDTLTVGGVTFTVQNPRQDIQAAMWLLDLRRD